MARTTAALHDRTPRTVRAHGGRRYSRPPRGAPRQPFVVRLPVEDKQQIEYNAQARRATVTAIILQAVEEYLALPVAERDAGRRDR